MSQRLKDLSVVFVIVSICGIGLANYLPELAQRFETSLRANIQATLQEQDMNWVKVNVDGRDVVLQGQASTRIEYNAATTLLSEIPGIRQMDNLIEVQVKRVTPYTLIAEYQAGQLKLTGYVPNKNTQQQLQEYLHTIYSEQDMTNELNLASGEPAYWSEALYLLLKKLPQLQRARLEVINYDIRLTGVVDSDELIQTLKQELLVLKDYHYHAYISLQVAGEKPPLRNPYLLTADYQNDQLSLEGYFSDHNAQIEIEELLRNTFTKHTLHTNLSLASGAPSHWLPSMHLLIENLAQFKRARLEVSNYNIRLSGIVATSRQIEQIEKNLTALSKNHYQTRLYLKAADEKAPTKRVSPYTFSAEYKNKELRLSGYFPHQEARRKAITTARNVFSQEKLIDGGLQIASGEPAQWQAVIIQLLESLPQFQHARLEINDYDVRLTGLVATTETLQKLEQMAKPLLDNNYHLHLYVQAADSRTRLCQRKFNGLLSSDKIVFDSNSAIINAESYVLLERLIDIAERCPESSITISGHTDNIGEPQKNLELSQQRAEAVQDYLTRNGIDASRLKASGYGELRPITDNDSLASRAKNRRIEFLIEGY